MARQKTTKRAAKQDKNRSSRHFLSWPLVVFLLLCAGAYLVTATFKAGADDIFVTAAVHAPPVTSPAQITSPTDGSRFTSVPITVTGICPAGASYVEIFRNNLMSGSTPCSSTSSFQLDVDLFPGQNSLVAHVFNITDDEGPVSNTITVFYDVPTPVPQPSGSGSSSSATPSEQTVSSPLTLMTNFIYKGYLVGEQVSWPIEISGGTLPYAINVNWGDGHNDVISRDTAGQFDLSHVYQKPNDKGGFYTIKIQASDANSSKAYLQIFIVVHQKGAAAGPIFNKPPPSLNSNTWIWVAWSAYAVVLLMSTSYLLGEKAELINLRHHGMLRH